LTSSWQTVILSYMKHIEKYINEYLEDHKLAWATTSLRSERYRLNGVAAILDGNPETLWDHMETKNTGRYSRVTLWTRVSHFWSWCLEEGKFDGKNEYKRFRRKNARLFKNTYVRFTPSISYSDAQNRINTIGSEMVRRSALQLLEGGLRSCELRSRVGSGVVGKGGKYRETYLPSVSDNANDKHPSYSTIYRALQKVGLRPHDLRKIAATHFYEKGLSDVDLCEVMGWNSFETARSYLSPKKKEEIEKIIRRA